MLCQTDDQIHALEIMSQITRVELGKEDFQTKTAPSTLKKMNLLYLSYCALDQFGPQNRRNLKFDFNMCGRNSSDLSEARYCK